ASSAEPRPIPAPLLPPPLLAPASFLWLWVLPLGILGLLNFHGYWLIGSEMDAGQRGWAHLLGWALAADLASGVGVFCLTKFYRPAAGAFGTDHPLWGLPGLLLQIGYLWIAMAALGDGMLPRTMTAWIYPEPRYLFNQFTFCMLPAFHGILR